MCFFHPTTDVFGLAYRPDREIRDKLVGLSCNSEAAWIIVEQPRQKFQHPWMDRKRWLTVLRVLTVTVIMENGWCVIEGAVIVLKEAVIARFTLETIRLYDKRKRKWNNDGTEVEDETLAEWVDVKSQVYHPSVSVVVSSSTIERLSQMFGLWSRCYCLFEQFNVIILFQKSFIIHYYLVDAFYCFC